jgi:hypothetical protein
MANPMRAHAVGAGTFSRSAMQARNPVLVGTRHAVAIVNRLQEGVRSTVAAAEAVAETVVEAVATEAAEVVASAAGMVESVAHGVAQAAEGLAAH